MLHSVKKSMRISETAFDSELNDLISACQQELKANDVDIDSTKFSELIKLAVIYFCKANFGSNQNSEKYKICYENLKSYLMTACRKGESGE